MQKAFVNEIILLNISNYCKNINEAIIKQIYFPSVSKTSKRTIQL